MIYLKLHTNGTPIIVNANHIDWITEYKGCAEIMMIGYDNALYVDETVQKVLQEIHDVCQAIARYGE